MRMGVDRVKYSVSKRAKCPFYKGEYRQEIFCEGLIQDSNIHQGYANPGLLNEYKQKHCEADYHSCPIAQVLEKKWDSVKD